MEQVNTYKPGVVNVTESSPFLGSVVNGIPAAPVGKIKLVRVWTVFEFPENFTRTPVVATASERVPAISTPVSNQRPGVSVSEKLTSFVPPSLLTAAGTKAAAAATNRHARIHPFLFELVIADLLYYGQNVVHQLIKQSVAEVVFVHPYR